MGSYEDTVFTVPTIDLSDYIRYPDSKQADEAVEQIRKACASSGFFQLIGHGILETLQQQAFTAAKDFFSLPDVEKRELRGKPGRGYEVIGTQFLEPGKKADLKEVGANRSRPGEDCDILTKLSTAGLLRRERNSRSRGIVEPVSRAQRMANRRASPRVAVQIAFAPISPSSPPAISHGYANPRNGHERLRYQRLHRLLSRAHRFSPPPALSTTSRE